MLKLAYSNSKPKSVDSKRNYQERTKHSGLSAIRPRVLSLAEKLARLEAIDPRVVAAVELMIDRRLEREDHRRRSAVNT